MSWKLGETKHMYASLTEGPNKRMKYAVSRTKMIAMPLFEQALP